MRTQTEMELKLFKEDEKVYHAMRDAALMKQPVTGISSADEKIQDVSRKQ